MAPHDPIPLRAALELLHHEAITREAFLDTVARPPVWTWSVGLTPASGHDVTRYIDSPAPIDRCLEVFVWALQRYAAEVRAAFRRPLTEPEFAAALSFHWNTGAIGRATWVRQVNAGETDKARASILSWKSTPASRRIAERDLFFDGRWAGDGRVIEYPVDRATHRPVWSRGRTVEVAGLLEQILAAPAPAVAPPPARKPLPRPEAPAPARPGRSRLRLALLAAALGVLLAGVALAVRLL